jgi:hypothetical protein
MHVTPNFDEKNDKLMEYSLKPAEHKDPLYVIILLNSPYKTGK